MRWILRIGGALVLAALLGLVGLLLIPADRIAAIAGDQLRRLTGREVTISGDVQLTLWPVLGVSAGGLEVGNADWAGEGAMLSTGSAAIGVDLMALLGGEIRITEVRAESPTIRLESRSDGRASWRFTDAGGEAAIATETGPARAPRPFSIARLEITDATLIYLAEGAAPVRQEGVDLTLDWPEPRASPRACVRRVRSSRSPPRWASSTASWGAPSAPWRWSWRPPAAGPASPGAARWRGPWPGIWRLTWRARKASSRPSAPGRWRCRATSGAASI
jgi:hypothetical protein